jgi:hypothetical protein
MEFKALTRLADDERPLNAIPDVLNTIGGNWKAVWEAIVEVNDAAIGRR